MHRSQSREIINASRPDPKTYKPGQRVFARRAVKSNKGTNVVAKTKFAYTGPWIIQRKLDGASYEIKHAQTGKIDKKHAAFLSPFPDQLLPLLPLEGPDNSFGQLHAKLKPDAYKDAGIHSFIPGQPYNENGFNILFSTPIQTLHFPTISEINNDLFSQEYDFIPPAQMMESYECFVSVDKSPDPPIR